MIDILLTFFCFSGFIYSSSRWLKIDFSYAPLFSVSLVGILLFVSAVFNYLEPGTKILVYTGFCLTCISAIDIWKFRNSGKHLPDVRLFIPFASLVFISYLVPLWMKFTVIDDYVYWGIIGKYLYLNHHLPDSNTTIIARHLAYTPGTSLFHYLFYTLTGKYSPAISYYAQNILLISALFVVIRKETIKRTVIFLCILVTLLTLFSGSVFTKLQVDYLLSIYFFAVLWIYFKEKPSLCIIMTIIFPVCFLFLIKEIGFALGLLIFSIIFFDIVFSKGLEKKIKIKSILCIILAGSFLFLLKQIWGGHLEMMGFLKFSSAVNMESIKLSFAVFSNETVKKGFLIFIKDILIGPADRLNLPYIVWYIAMIFFWFKILGKQGRSDKERYTRLLIIISVSFAIYLAMLYLLQIIVFKVGINYDHTVGLTRYMNIFFSPVMFFLILLYVDQYFFQQKIPTKLIYLFVIVVMLVLGFSRIETSLHRDDHYQFAELIANKIEMSIYKEKKNFIGIVPGVGDNNFGIKLLYHLLPNTVNIDGFPVQNRDIFLSELLQYDYVFFNKLNDNIIDWLNPYMETSIEPLGFFRIIQDGMYKVENKNLRLEKIF